MRSLTLILIASLLINSQLLAQPCTPQGTPTVYGTNNVWIGYVYDNIDFTNYRGYVNQGNSSSLNFDQNFGGDDVTYTTNGCSIQTSTFSVRYRLNKTFTSGTYQFVVGGDDGYRLSFDGGATWAVNNWGDHGYTTTTHTTALNGNIDMVLEFYENGGANRISIAMTEICTATGNPATYGTSNVWNGYVYDGTNFDTFVGVVTEGTSSNPNFDQSFGGSNVTYNTGSCGTQTETFSVRYRLRKTFANGNYQFTVGADDGYRLSLDGGSTWVIDRWVAQSYASTTTSSIPLNGTRDLVLEYYENSGDNRVSFAMQTLSILPVTMEWFTAQEKNGAVVLTWKVSSDSNPASFEIQKSNNGTDFTTVGTIQKNINTGNNEYTFTDNGANGAVTYYRLRITDLDALVSYSKTVSFRNAATAGSDVKMYPTVLTGNSFYVKSSNNLHNAVAVIRDFQGRTVSSQVLGNITAGQELKINMNTRSNSKGIYSVSISSAKSQQVFTGRIIVQ